MSVRFEADSSGFDQRIMLRTEERGLLEYGLVEGNGDLVLIKAGAMGDCRGYQDKYVRLARRLHEKRGCTVLCAPNPTTDSFVRYDETVLREVLSKLATPAKLYFFGNSNGAYQGLQVASQRHRFEKMILVNMPLMVNFHRTKEVLYHAECPVEFFYGDRDPSYRYLPYLRLLPFPWVRINVLEGADHRLQGMDEKWEYLGDTFFDETEPNTSI